MGDSTQEKTKSFNKGQMIFREGQLNPVAYMVKKGTVSIYRVVNNRKVIVGRMLPGQIFGESAVITGAPFHANAVADDFVDLLVIDQATLKTLLLKCPGPMQRIVRYLMDRISVLERAVHEQPAPNSFLSICQILELTHKATRPPAPAAKGGDSANVPVPFSYVDFCRNVRNVLLVSQLEIDEVLERLQRLGVMTISEIKSATYRKDVLGNMNVSSEYVQDKHLALKEPASFMTVARNLSMELPEKMPPCTSELDFIDMQGLAEMVKSTPEILYKKLAQHEIPQNLFFFPADAMREWAQVKGEDFFQRVKRKRLNIDELESVDDLVFVDNNTLRDVFQKIGFHKVLVLYAGAQEETRTKMLGCMSGKIAAMVKEESVDRAVDDMELADVEAEAIALVRDLKGDIKGAAKEERNAGAKGADK